MMESNIRAYLEELESGLMFGRCAGKNAYLSKLFQNKAENANQRVLNFERLRRCLNYHPLGPNPGGYASNVDDIFEEFISDGITAEGDFVTVRDPLNYSWKYEEPYFGDLTKDRELIIKVLEIYERNNFSTHFANADDSGLVFEEMDLGNKEQSLTWRNLVRACDNIFNDLSKIKEIWQFIDSKSAIVSSKNSDKITSDFSQQHLGSGFVDRISSILESQKTYIFGGPGYGKTIFLQQIVSEITSHQLSNKKDNCLIPIFVKAKYISEGIINTLSAQWAISKTGEQIHETSIMKDMDKSNVVHWGLKMDPLENGLDEVAKILTFAIKKTLPNLSAGIVNGLFKDDFKEDFDAGVDFLGRVVLFVDAYDECPTYTDNNKFRNNRLDLITLFVDDVLEMYLKNLVITCRSTHRKEITRFTEEVGGAFHNGESTWDLPYFQILEMKFTDADLRYEMPLKLANAWGLNPTNLDWEVQKNFDKYKEVLTHPLFVGLFCLMINEEGYDLGKASKEIPDCEYDEYGPHHVKFIQSVINYGVEISIKSRFPDINDASLQKIRRAFLYFAAGSLIHGWNDISTLWGLIEENKINLTKEEKEIMKNELGVVYLSDGNEISWTHKTVSEVATGMLLFEESNLTSSSGNRIKCCLDFLSKTFPIIKVEVEYDGKPEYEIDRLGSYVWSECMILTLGLLCSENNKEPDYRLTLMKSINYLEKYSWGENTLQIIFFYQEVYSVPDDWKIDPYVPWEILFENRTLEYQLAEIYLEYVFSKICESPLWDTQNKKNKPRIQTENLFVRVPSSCFKEYTRDYHRTAVAVEVFNKIELYVGRYPVIETYHKTLQEWPPLRLTKENFDDYKPSKVKNLQPNDENVSATWKLITRHFHQTLLCQQSGINPDPQADILLRRLKEWTGDGGDASYNRVFHFEVPGASTSYGFKSRFMQTIIGIYNNYGKNDELLNYISRRYAKNIFDEDDHKNLVSQFKHWLDEISLRNHLPKMFTPHEIDCIKTALTINNDDLLIIVIYSVYCNPNITRRGEFYGSDDIIQYISSNEDKHKGVYYIG